MIELSTSDDQDSRIEVDAPWTTTIGFLHVDPDDQDLAVDLSGDIATLMAAASNPTGAAPTRVHVLRSLDGSRVCTYAQWPDDVSVAAALSAPGVEPLLDRVADLADNDTQHRRYDVVHADDRSEAGVSTIGAGYTGAIFINEITTRPPTQDRLLQLVIANNAAQSLGTPGYRSANFHRSTDGRRAVSYSLWDTPEQCIDAISRMADMDENLDETVEIAEPDFRFYALVHTAGSR